MAGLESVERLAKRREERLGFRVYVVEPSILREAARGLHAAGYTYLLSVSGVDDPKAKRIRVVYHFARPDEPGDVVALETSVPRDEPRLPSIHDIYPAAQLQERETHEMLGVVFEGNPDLRHLLLPPDWPQGVYPLRKDYRVVDEPIMSRRPSRPLAELQRAGTGAGAAQEGREKNA